LRDRVVQGASIHRLRRAGRTVSNPDRPASNTCNATAEYARLGLGYVCATSVPAISCRRQTSPYNWAFHARLRPRRSPPNWCFANAEKRCASHVHSPPDRHAAGLRVAYCRTSVRLSCVGQQRSSDRWSRCKDRHRQRAGRLHRDAIAPWETTHGVTLQLAPDGPKKSFRTFHFFAPFALGARQRHPFSPSAQRADTGEKLALALVHRRRRRSQSIRARRNSVLVRMFSSEP